ncbi:MAG: sporulation protein YqfD [Clostridia bacterium]|nr:sporulation protein YqfD [Clostridia bacterium]
MVKIEFLVFGYRRLVTAPENLSLLSSLLVRSGISSVITADGAFLIRERDFETIRDLMSGRIEFSCSKPLGLYGMWKGYTHKAALLLSLALMTALVLFLSCVVWDIRVEGNSTVTDGEIILGLSDCGLQIGDLWMGINRSRVEAEFLDKYEDLSWININRRGCVAYVKVIEADVHNEPQSEISPKYSNIVSKSDCIIEEITVKSGTANVRVGDAVKKGDLLVIGVLPEEAGGGLCAAEATVIGRINDSASVEIGRSEDKITYSDRKIYSITLKFFKFSLNIFKLYGNLTNEYDIIDNEIAYSLFGRYKLPLSIKTVYCVKRESNRVVFSDDELALVAKERLNAKIAARLLDADLLKLSTIGEFTENGYYLKSDIVYLTEVGEQVGIQLD